MSYISGTTGFPETRLHECLQRGITPDSGSVKKSQSNLSVATFPDHVLGLRHATVMEVAELVRTTLVAHSIRQHSAIAI